MAKTIFQKSFAPIKKFTPVFFWDFLRSFLTAFLTPFYFSYRTGHFKSSFYKKAVSRKGLPLPWYTYPCIDFLGNRDYEDKTILEFGGGQSTLWWAKVAKRVVTFENDPQWYGKLKKIVSENVSLYFIESNDRLGQVKKIDEILNHNESNSFDVVIIDSLDRPAMVPIAIRVMAKNGFIVVDDSEGYGFREDFENSGLNRVDFFGHVPGVILPHCTSIFFRNDSFIFSSKFKIPHVL